MRVSLKEMLAAVAIMALAFGFALHVRTTTQKLHNFELNSRHLNAERDFQFRMVLVEENFRRAGYIFLSDIPADQVGVAFGTFERKYSWATDGKPAISGMEFCELLRPLRYGFMSSQRIHWGVETEPTLRQIQAAADQSSGTIVIQVSYRLH